MASDPPPVAKGSGLEWLDTKKVLELAAHDLNNMAHAALSYIELASDPQMDEPSRAKFLRHSHEIVKRGSLFSPNLLQLVLAIEAPLASSPSGPLKAALAEAVDRHRERFPDARLKVGLTGDAWEASVLGGPFIVTVLYHLIDNGNRYPKPGGPSKVSVDATRDGASVRITVTDEGKGFSPGQEKYAAARFSEPGRVSGAGLGLATARIVAQGAGGSLHLGNADSPHGARVVLRLPAAPPDK